MVILMRLKNIILYLILIFAISLSLFIISCAQPDDIKNQVSSGGQNVSQDAKKEIVGAKDIHITKAVNSIDEFINDVKFVENYKQSDVIAIYDNSIFGKVGIYDLVYTNEAGDCSASVKIYIYDLPTVIDSDGQNIAISYSETYNNLGKNIVIKDSFNNALDVRIIDDGGLFNKDGSHNAGDFTVEFAATDKAGQTVTVVKFVSVGSPLDVSIYDAVYDFCDAELFYELSKEELLSFMAFSVNGEPVSPDFTQERENGVAIKREFFNKFNAEDSLVIKIITKNGFGTANVTIKDEGQVEYDDSALVNYFKKSYAIFETHNIPSIALTNDKQVVAPEYYLLDKQSQSETKLSDRRLLMDDDREWQLKIVLRGEQTLLYDIIDYVNLGYCDNINISSDNMLQGQVSNGFVFSKYILRRGNTIVKQSSDYISLTDFNTALLSLDGTLPYTLDIVASKGGKTYTQTVRANIMSAGIYSILTTEKELGINAFTNSKYSTLKLTDEYVKGLTNVFRWDAVVETANQINSGIRFSTEIMNSIDENDYLIFDFYCEKPLSLILYDSEVPNFICYSSYSSGSETSASFEVYDLDGNKIVGGPNLNRVDSCGQWYTFKIKLKQGFSENPEKGWVYNGLCPYDLTIGKLWGNDVYIANIKYYTPNSEVPPEPEITPDDGELGVKWEWALPDEFLGE